MPDAKALKDELEALQIALKTEEDGYHYYKESSEKTNNAVAKKFLATIANEECAHIFLIKDFYRSLLENREGKEITIPVMPEDYKTRIKTIFQEARKELQGANAADTGVLEVYRKSMDLESNAANFYKEHAAKTKFDQVRKLYEWLFRFESDHYRMFSETLSYLEKPDLWFLEQEKSIFEG